MEQKCEKRQEWVELGSTVSMLVVGAQALRSMGLARQEDSLWNLTLVLVK